MLRAMAQISRESLTTECFGFDPYLQHQRMKRASLAAGTPVPTDTAEGFFGAALTGVRTLAL